ncbi:hypothetical protein I0P70_17595 [Pontibacter sp. FD36]|uniref:hypothetical protein n=1 Tax=Pontibacter sp. FD36 TaxID=2789860 RepID=UPI0018AC50B4|nr:hypothetical protein [Pontibacter sp. FD36]MBF8965066.1 hypothetical protein [Pontibacter sp. FD36]
MKAYLRIALPFLLLFWSSCSSEETAPVVEVPPCLLMEQTSTLTYASGSPIKPQTITTRLEYNDRNALAAIFQTEYAGTYFDRADLKYNKQGQVTEVVHKNYRYVNEYNGQGKLAKQTRFAKRMGDFKEEQLAYYTLSYNSQQELAEAQQFSMDTGKPVLELVWRYTYDKGDPVYLEQLEPGGESYYHVQMTYDMHEKPSTSYAHTYFEPLRPPSAHNQLSYTVRETNPSYASHSTTYTYNQAGYPVTATTRYSDGREEVVTYTYMCK